MFQEISQYKWIPIEEAIIDQKYNGYKTQDESNIEHFCSIQYKGNGIGWQFCKEDNIINNITHLQQKRTHTEISDLKRKQIDLDSGITQLNLYGVFTNLHSVGDACHEYWNGWISDEFAELDYELHKDNTILVGIAEAPYQPNYHNSDYKYIAFVAEYLDTGERFWCHGSELMVDMLREDAKKLYEKLKEREKNARK